MADLYITAMQEGLVHFQKRNVTKADGSNQLNTLSQVLVEALNGLLAKRAASFITSERAAQMN